MKNIAAIAIFVAATFTAAGSASAQDAGVKATVPFNFTVGNLAMPSGTYTIRESTLTPELLLMRNWDAKVNVMSVGEPTQSDPRYGDVLVFHRYGNQYFLSDIYSRGSSLNIHYPTTKAEKRAKAQIEEAQQVVDAPILIALK
jgi:hypothetical protein